MNRLLIHFTFVIFIFVVAGCDSGSDSGDARSCSLDVGPETLSAASEVEYKATLAGQGRVTSLTYRAGDQTQTVSNPTMPWSTTVNAAQDDVISMEASGSVEDGRIDIRVEAAGGGSTVTLTDLCEQTL